MLQKRRTFFKKGAQYIFSGALGLSFSGALSKTFDVFDKKTPAFFPDDQEKNADYWAFIADCYRPDPTFINLENGYFSPQPTVVLEQLIRDFQKINAQTSLYMRKQQQQAIELVVSELATFSNTDPKEILVCRNTTEALNIVLQGLPLQAGDHFLLTNQDYPTMVETLEFIAEKKKVQLNRVNLPLRPKNKQEVLDLFEKAYTPKTKAVLLTEMINWTGQILPIKELVKWFREKGVYTIVDGAHAFAHIRDDIGEIGADFYAASLHKWLCAPMGTGLLYVRKDQISTLTPLFADKYLPKDDINKLGHFGTMPIANMLGIISAIKFHQKIGTQRKKQRLRALKDYWLQPFLSDDRFEINTPTALPEQACAIANIAIKGLDATQLAERLFSEHRIFTVAIDIAAVKGIRVTPHIYTQYADLDRFISALKQIAPKP